MASLTEEARSWSVEQVFDWAKEKHGGETANKLKEHNVNGEALFTLLPNNFSSMQILVGPRRKLLNSIADLKGAQKFSSTSFTPQYDARPYSVLQNLVTPEDVTTIRDFFSKLSAVPGDAKVADHENTHGIYKELLRLPSLEKKLHDLYPDLVVFQTNYFGGSESGVYTGWQTGANVAKIFAGEPRMLTVWIPLQSLTAETGGRLSFYSGDYVDSIVDLFSATNKLSVMFQYVMLESLKAELEKHKITDDAQVGNGFVFQELHPHSVEKCSIKRDVLYVRLVARDAVIDTSFLDVLAAEQYPEAEKISQKINFVDTKENFFSIREFLAGTKASWEASLKQ